jgi:hypothetical protein
MERDLAERECPGSPAEAPPEEGLRLQLPQQPWSQVIEATLRKAGFDRRACRTLPLLAADDVPGIDGSSPRWAIRNP